MFSNENKSNKKNYVYRKKKIMKDEQTGKKYTLFQSIKESQLSTNNLFIKLGKVSIIQLV